MIDKELNIIINVLEDSREQVHVDVAIPPLLIIELEIDNELMHTESLDPIEYVSNLKLKTKRPGTRTLLEMLKVMCEAVLSINEVIDFKKGKRGGKKGNYN
ncbi:hypothetical protein ACJX0J_025197, partial [Zea mays]